MSEQFAQQGVDTEYAEGDVRRGRLCRPRRDAVVDAQADGAASDEAVEVATMRRPTSSPRT